MSLPRRPNMKFIINALLACSLLSSISYGGVDFSYAPPISPAVYAPAIPVTPSAPFAHNYEEDTEIVYDGLGLEYGQNWDEIASLELKNSLEYYDISDRFSKRLRYVQGKKIVFVLDDSGSMTNPSDDSPCGDNLRDEVYSGYQKFSRWDELVQYVKAAIKIYGDLSCNGVDFYFLNRGYVKNVKAWDQISARFESGPYGLTPLSSTFEQIIADHAEAEHGLVINIITDGSPRSERYEDSIDVLGKKMRSALRRYQDLYINIRLCTDNDGVIKDYNTFDKAFPRTDVCDDYKSEYKEVLKAKKIKMTRGEYLLKSTIGAADKTPGRDNLDKWDECTGFRRCLPGFFR